jgi:hypothetical protein
VGRPCSRGSHPQCPPTVKRTPPRRAASSRRRIGVQPSTPFRSGQNPSHPHPSTLLSRKWRCSAPVRRAGGRTPRSADAHWRHPQSARSRRRVGRGSRSPLDSSCTTRSRLVVRLREEVHVPTRPLSLPPAAQLRARGPEFGAVVRIERRETDSRTGVSRLPRATVRLTAFRAGRRSPVPLSPRPLSSARSACSAIDTPLE